MTWLKGLGSTAMPMVLNMWGTGTKTNNMVLEKSSGMMAVSTRDSIRTQARKDKVNTAGQMGTGMWVNGKTTCSMAKDSFYGTMTDST